MASMDEKPLRFSLSQLLWATVLIGLWLGSVHLSLTVDIRQPPEPFWWITAVATPPIAGGLFGLLIDGLKGMLYGIALGIGFLLLIAVPTLFPQVY